MNNLNMNSLVKSLKRDLLDIPPKKNLIHLYRIKRGKFELSKVSRRVSTTSQSSAGAGSIVRYALFGRSCSSFFFFFFEDNKKKNDINQISHFRNYYRVYNFFLFILFSSPKWIFILKKI